MAKEKDKMADQTPGRPKKKLGMPERILIGLGLGIATGLFLGELAAPLKYVGDAFVGLLQMTVMPFIVLALIGGIGKLNKKQRRLLLLAGNAQGVFIDHIRERDWDVTLHVRQEYLNLLPWAITDGEMLQR